MSSGWAPLLGAAEGTPTLNPTGLVGVHPTGCGEQNRPRGSRQKKPGCRRRDESGITVKALGVIQG